MVLGLLVSVGKRGFRGRFWYLTSAKVEGRSTIRAPPKRGVLRYVVMLRSWKFVNVSFPSLLFL